MNELTDRRTTRKRFLAEAAGFTGAIVAGALSRPAEAASAPKDAATSSPAATNRVFITEHLGLQLGAVFAGEPWSAAGGGITANVVHEASGTTFVPKHLEGPLYEEFALKVAAEMDPSFYSWIANAFADTPQAKNGALISFDAKTQRNFSQALLTAVSMPALDAASKDAASLTVKFAGLNYADATALIAKPPASKTPTIANRWLAANFALQINGGIDTTKVTKVDAFAVTFGLTPPFAPPIDEPPIAVIGGSDLKLQLPPIDFPNLRVTFSATSAASWKSWHQNMVVHGAADERNGKLIYTDGKGELGHIDLFNVGIFDLQPVGITAGSETVKRMQADLYVERMAFQFGTQLKPAP